VTVLHAADFGGVAPGSFIPMMAALARLLRARGDCFVIVAPQIAGATWHDMMREAGAELHLVGGADEAARLARAADPDVVHLHFYGWEIPVTLAAWSSRARIFWHTHSSRPEADHPPVRPTLRTLARFRLAGRRVERFLTVSQALADELIALGAPRARVTAVPNAIDLTRFRPPSDGERAAARAELGLEGPAVLFFGRDPQIKGADVLAGALAELHGVTVVAVATPPDVVRALPSRTIAIERRDDVVPLLWACDALAIPSRREGFALVLAEALAAGLPAAASDLPALRETADAYGATAFAPAGDARAFAAALRATLSRGRTATPARVAEAGLDAWARRIVALYD